MTRDQIIKLQQRIGTKPDGVWGSDSIRCCQAHLRALMPKPNPWPRADQASLRKFYGEPCDAKQQTRFLVPPGVTVRYFDKELGKPGPMDDFISCHKKVEDSLRRILIAVMEVAPEVLRQYAGVINCRSVTGGSSPSLHAYSAAIDLDPATNGMYTHWPTKATMPIEVMECFAREGWLPAGAFWHRDAMHFQATQ